MYSKLTGRKTWRKTQKQIEGGKRRYTCRYTSIKMNREL